MRKKSVQHHVEAGNFRPGRHGARVQQAAQAPAKPRGLDAERSKLWAEFTRLLADRLRPEDGPLVQLVVEWFATWRTAKAKLGTLECGTLEYARALAAVGVASTRFEACAKRLGMSPVDREQLTLKTPGQAGGVITW